MCDPCNLCWFGLSALDKAWTPEDTNWAMTLHIAAAATKLETLVLPALTPMRLGKFGLIVSSVHLFPWVGPLIPREWNSFTVLEQCQVFYITYIEHLLTDL